MRRASRAAVVLAAAIVLAPEGLAAQAAVQKKVLVVYSARRETQMAATGDRQIPGLLEQALGQKVDYYAEHLDGARFPEPTYQTAFRDYLRLKYAGMRFDAVVAVQRFAYDIVASVRAQLFSTTPVVFLSQDPRVSRIANSAEIIAETDYRRTIALATALQPETTDVFVIGGSSVRDAALVATAAAQLDTLAPRLRFTYLTGLTTEALERRLAALPERSIVYYLIFYQGADGANVDPIDYLARLTQISNRPVYSWVTTALDRGIVGGALVDVETEIRLTAALTARVLRGETADRIPAQTAAVQTDIVDWRQLRRWNLNAGRLPPGTDVRYQEPSAWERDRGYFLAGLLVMMLQTSLIVALVRQAVRRRRDEDPALDTVSNLHRSYDRIRHLGRRLLTVQETERARIARELHDDISQRLTLLSIDLGLLSRRKYGDAEELEKLSQAQARAAEVAASVHELSHQLHPAKLRLVGLVAALHGLQAETSEHGPAVTCVCDGVPSSMSQDLMLCLYRVAQEALQNAIKHGRANRVALTLTGGSGRLLLMVTDDGRGFDMDAPHHHGLGLISMEERLEPFGGTLRVHSKPGMGTCVEAVVPTAVTDADAACRRTA